MKGQFPVNGASIAKRTVARFQRLTNVRAGAFFCEPRALFCELLHVFMHCFRVFSHNLLLNCLSFSEDWRKIEKNYKS